MADPSILRLSTHSGINLSHYKTTSPKERQRVPFSTCVLVFVLQGNKVVWTNTGKISVETGAGFMLKTGNYLMSERFSQQQVYESISLSFRPQDVLHLLTPLTTNRPISVAPRQDGLLIPPNGLVSAYLALLKSYFSVSMSSQESNQLVALKVQELFWLLEHVTPGFTDFSHSLVNQEAFSLETLMQKHFRESLSLEDLSFLAGCSLSTFKRRFIDHFQVSPHQWIRDRRLTEAAYLLHSSDLTIDQISQLIGYVNVSHFIQLFKEKYTHTPKTYRNDLNEL